MIIIGITGTIGAGKGTVVEYLKQKGFAHYSARAFLLAELQRRGLEPIRDNIVITANDLRKTHYPGYIIGELLKDAQKTDTDAVIESVRAIGEVNLLRKAPNFYLLAVDADIKLRYERIVKRGNVTDHISYEKFLEDERKEFESKEPWSQNIKACMALANTTIENNGSVEELNAKVDQFLASIKA